MALALLVLAWAGACQPNDAADDKGTAGSDDTDVVLDTDSVETDVPDDTDTVPSDTDTVPNDSDTFPGDSDSGTPMATDCTAGTTLIDAWLGTVVCIPSGTFMMGCVAGRDDVDAACSSNESPPRTVELTRPFWIMEAEVTQWQYLVVLGLEPSAFVGQNLPVDSVSWEDAVAFADAVSLAQGLSPCGSGSPYGCEGWRLPTEAEWEYAARGGEGFPYAGDFPSAVAWFGYNSGDFPHAFCTKARNGFGLCDMSGNLWEWTWDWYGPYPSTASTDPTGPASGSTRVRRGGGWRSVEPEVRVAHRSDDPPGEHADDLGFRLVRSVP